MEAFSSSSEHEPTPVPTTAGDRRPAPRAPTPDPYVTIRPWVDPRVDDRGHDPRSAYVERYWLSVIGPTATWIMRRFADEFDRDPDGFIIDLAHTASTMGLSYRKGQHSPFGRSLRRCIMFDLAMPTPDGFAVRRKFPNVAQRHITRLPDDVQRAHYDWSRRTVRVDRRGLEQQLVELGVTPGAAARASEAIALAS